MRFPSGPLAEQVGSLLCRLVVPAWVFTGAMFKLIERTPRNLPKNIFEIGVKQIGIPGHALLATLIAIEILAVAIMFFVGSLARAVAIFMLSVFVLVLLAELATGNFTSCGCFGKLPVPPWVMLVADGALLAGVILFRPRRPDPQQARSWPFGAVAAAVLAIAGAVVSYAEVLPAARAQPVENTQPPRPSTDPRVNPDPLPLPGLWYIKGIEEWVGKPWRDLELFRFMPYWPGDMDGPLHYVILYRRSCEHCEEMFNFELAADEALCRTVTVVEVPEDKVTLRTDSPWPMPENACEHMELPLGCDWIMTTPVVIRVENGKVACAREGDHAPCMLEAGTRD